MRNTKTGPEGRKGSLIRKPQQFLVTVTPVGTKYRINQKEIAEQVRRILKAERKAGKVDVILAGDKLLKKLNQKFAGKDKITDVLSFPLDESPGEKSNYLGEIYISPGQAQRQAKEYKVTLQKEVLRLATHGTLHLLGYDHKNASQVKIMQRKEEQYLNAKT